MPTNFTVVKVEDVGEGSNSAAAAAGDSRPLSLDKVFQEEGDVTNSQEPEPGRGNLKTAYVCFFLFPCS